MKICAVICEYNPFHNGHAYLFSQIRRANVSDKILCIMSGNFTQRGEPAVLNQYERARLAVECGADAVIALPAPFSVSPAELFARGAVHLISAIPFVNALAFGCESGTKTDFISCARATLTENPEFKSALKEKMKDGTSYVRARNELLLAEHPELDAVLRSPNNILGLEYCRALLDKKLPVTPLPVKRQGSGHDELAPRKNYSSASALRPLIHGTKKDGALLKRNVPAPVFDALSSAPDVRYREAAVCALLSSAPERIALCPDCSEGLENKLLASAKTQPDYDKLLGGICSKRYTLSRLKRILAQNFLGIRLKEVKDFLKSPLYLNVLAVKGEDGEAMLSALGKSSFPLLVRKNDSSQLKGNALACFERDAYACELYGAISQTPCNPYETVFVK